MIPAKCPKCGSSSAHFMRNPTKDAQGRVGRWWHCIICGYGDDLEYAFYHGTGYHSPEPEQLSITGAELHGSGDSGGSALPQYANMIEKIIAGTHLNQSQPDRDDFDDTHDDPEIIDAEFTDLDPSLIDDFENDQELEFDSNPDFTDEPDPITGAVQLSLNSIRYK